MKILDNFNKMGNLTFNYIKMNEFFESQFKWNLKILINILIKIVKTPEVLKDFVFLFLYWIWNNLIFLHKNASNHIQIKE